MLYVTTVYILLLEHMNIDGIKLLSQVFKYSIHACMIICTYICM